MAAAATGWVGFGIAEASGMPGADIVMFECKEPETLKDYHALVYGCPILDDCPSDWTLLDHVKSDDMIAFRATHAIDTQDPQDRALVKDRDIVTVPTPTIAAWGDEETLSFYQDRHARSSVRFFQESTSGSTKPKTTEELLEEMADGVILLANDNYT